MQDTDRLECNYDVETALGKINIGEKPARNEYVDRGYILENGCGYNGCIVEDNKSHNNLRAKTKLGNITVDFK